jgi:hypothetical protein
MSPNFARADNIERVRRDEEEARMKEEREEGRMMMAVSYIKPTCAPCAPQISPTGADYAATLSRTQRPVLTSSVNVPPGSLLPQRNVLPG